MLAQEALLHLYVCSAYSMLIGEDFKGLQYVSIW